MKGIAIALTTIAALTGAANAMDVAQKEAADKVYAASKARRLTFQTPASKAELKKVIKSLSKSVPGRSCDAPDSDNNDPLLTCEMEDGTSISVEAVSAKMTNAEAEKQCVNPYADSPEEIEVELKPKKGFAMLWCTTKVRDWSKQAAEKRIAAAEPVPELEPVHADYDITYGKKIAFYGSSRQAISVKNNTGTGNQQVFIECGFFLKGELVGTGLGGVGNLMPGATKHTSILALDIEKFDKAECSVN